MDRLKIAKPFNMADLPGMVNECSCDTCKNMCKESRPCWGFPSEIANLINEGHGDNLMFDYWQGEGTQHDIDMVVPAIVGYEKNGAPFIPLGRCSLLMEDGLCRVHRIKPAEGKVAGCNKEAKDYHFIIRKAITKAWDTDEGKAVVKQFRLYCDIDTLEDAVAYWELYNV